MQVLITSEQFPIRNNLINQNTYYFRDLNVNIRIYHECEDKIENLRKITDWHHEACRVMPNSDREGRNPILTTKMDSFFLLTI